MVSQPRIVADQIREACRGTGITLVRNSFLRVVFRPESGPVGLLGCGGCALSALYFHKMSQGEPALYAVGVPRLRARLIQVPLNRDVGAIINLGVVLWAHTRYGRPYCNGFINGFDAFDAERIPTTWDDDCSLGQHDGIAVGRALAAEFGL